MNRKEIIESIILKYPVCEYYFGDKNDIIFSDKAWEICEKDCERYGHCWTCPPYCGAISDRISKCCQYQYFCLFSTVTETPDAWDKSANLKVKRQHDDIMLKIRDELKPLIDDFYVLSTGCTECKVCSCPKEPCRHPDKRFYSMESHGIIVMQMLDKLGMCYNYGGNTVVYFSMVLYNE